MKKIKWFYPVILFVLLLPQGAIARWKTPYHSIDENNFNSVIEALGSPTNHDRTVMRVAIYAKYNFAYVSDLSLFGENDYWQNPEKMFYNRKGDCEDWAAFFASVFEHHGIPVVSWGSWAYQLPYGHAFVTVPYKGKWAYLDSSSQVIYDGFSSQEKITDNFWERYGYKTAASEPIRLPEGGDGLNLSPKFTNSSRLQMHSHLTEFESNRVEVMIPVTREEKSYSKLANKEAIGFLVKTNFWKMKAMGFSYSEHGWYSPSREFNDQMYTLHFLFPYIGINAYTGDYQGVDIDVNPISLNFFKLYVCERNWGEVWDYKAVVIPLKFFEGVVEYNDRNLIYGAYLKLYESLSYCKLGYGSDKEWKIEIRDGGKGFNFSAGEYYKFSFTFDW